MEVSLNGSTIIWCVNIIVSSASFAELLREPFVPSSRSVMKMLNRTNFSTNPKRDTTGDGPPAGLPATGHNCLVKAVQSTLIQVVLSLSINLTLTSTVSQGVRKVSKALPESG